LRKNTFGQWLSRNTIVSRDKFTIYNIALRDRTVSIYAK